MVQRTHLARLVLAVLALALLSALPALAGPLATTAPAALPPSGCPAGGSLFGDLAPVAALPAWLDLGAKASATTVFHGYCRCTCSRIPDCNTDADCSNHRCLGGISCC